MRSPQPLPRNLFAQLARGGSYPLEGLRFISRERLWGVAWASVLVNIVLLVGLIALALVLVVPHVSAWVDGLSAWASGSHILGALAAVAAGLLWVAAVAAILVVDALVILLVGQAVASPFLDMLSERVESLVLGTPPAPFSARRTVVTVAISIADLLWSAVYWAAANLPLFVLVFFLPPVAAALSFAFSALLLAQEFVGLSLARQLVPFRRRWRALRGNRALAVGFGSMCMLLFAVPGLNLLLLPLAAAGGTLLYCDLAAAGRMPRPVAPEATRSRVA